MRFRVEKGTKQTMLISEIVMLKKYADTWTH